MPTFLGLMVRTKGLVAVLTAACCMAGAAHAGKQAFADAVLQYRADRLSDAFGRFMALANEGDPDAARIALFMHQYGPTLYGRYWEAMPHEVAAWQALSAKASTRPDPIFQPGWGSADKQKAGSARGVKKTSAR